MAASEVELANMALANLGTKSSIESLDETSAEAKQAKLWMRQARQQALTAHDWSFARKRQALALAGDDPPDGEWAFRYLYPVDCLVAREIVSPFGPYSDPIPYQVVTAEDGGSKHILTDMEDAVLRYTFDQTSTTMFTPHFDMALSHLLAYYMSVALTGKLGLRDRMLGAFNSLVRTAPSFDANEGKERKPREAEHIRARDT